MAGRRKRVAKPSAKKPDAARRKASFSSTSSADYEPRPNVRLVSRVPVRNAKTVLMRFGRRCLKQLRDNIATNMGGRWQPCKWGLKAGQPALHGSEDDWTVEMTSQRTLQLRPKRGKGARWRGHTGGPMDIVVRHAKAMPIRVDIPTEESRRSRDGMTIFRKKVHLPKRDPRPTISQLQRLAKE